METIIEQMNYIIANEPYLVEQYGFDAVQNQLWILNEYITASELGIDI
jgi:hypothetical protein